MHTGSDHSHHGEYAKEDHDHGYDYADRHHSHDYAEPLHGHEGSYAAEDHDHIAFDDLRVQVRELNAGHGQTAEQLERTAARLDGHEHAVTDAQVAQLMAQLAAVLDRVDKLGRSVDTLQVRHETSVREHGARVGEQLALLHALEVRVDQLEQIHRPDAIGEHEPDDELPRSVRIRHFGEGPIGGPGGSV